MNKNMKIVGRLPEELMLNIITRLPVKSLSRFKCVSKPMQNLIEHDSSITEKARDIFPLFWLVRAPGKSEDEDDRKICVYSIDCTGSATPYLTQVFENELANLKCCNGLIGYFIGGSGLHLTNITTDPDETICLSHSHHEYEICFDPSSSKFKVLRWESWESGFYDFEILTLEYGFSWRSVKNTLGIKDLSKPESGAIIVNGKMFWTHVHEKQIISFNSANEEFKAIAFPDEPNLDVPYILFEFEGLLSLLEQPQTEEPVFNLWILKEFNATNHWVLMKRNIALPVQGTKWYQHFLEDKDHCWKLNEMSISSKSAEIIMIPHQYGEDHERDTYVYFYSVLNGQIKIMNITETSMFFYGFKMMKFVENDVDLENYQGGISSSTSDEYSEDEETTSSSASSDQLEEV